MRLGDWVNRKANAYFAGSASRAHTRAEQPFNVFLPGIEPPGSDQLSEQRLVAASNSWSGLAQRAIANRLSKLLMVVSEIEGFKDGKPILSPIDDHPLLELLADPGASTGLHTREQLFRLHVRHYLATGDAYVHKVQPAVGAGTMELQALLPSMVRPIMGDGGVAFYRVRQDRGAPADVPFEEIIRIWDPDPNNLFSGRGNLQNVSTAHDTWVWAANFIKRTFEKNAIPPVVLETNDKANATDFAPDSDARKLWEDDWLENYNIQTGKNGVQPVVLPNGTVAKVLERAAFDDETVPLLEHFGNQELMSYQTPRSILGDVVDANRAAAETNQFVFDLYGVLPVACAIGDGYTAGFRTTGELEPNQVLHFEDFVRDDPELAQRQERQDLELGVTTINEVRERRGMTPVPWGNEPMQLSAARMMAEQMREGEDDDDEGGESDAGDPQDDENEENSRGAIRNIPTRRRRVG